jgi:antitoxin (DNA-binding transcriptional repressor) of toxin-antitoxin stability system
MAERFGKVSGMKTVTLDSFRKEPALLGSVASGEELLVTRFGKPYVRIVPASPARTFLGAAGRHASCFA